MGLSNINIQGFAVGNGMGSYKNNDNSLIFFAYYHGLLSDYQWKELTHECCEGVIDSDHCNFHDPTSSACSELAEQAMINVYEIGLNFYNLYGDCEETIHAEKYAASMELLFTKYPKLKSKNLKENVPCNACILKIFKKYVFEV